MTITMEEKIEKGGGTLARRRGLGHTCHHTAFCCVARYSYSDLKVWPSCPGLVCSDGISPASLLLRLGQSHPAVGMALSAGADTW